MARRLSLLASGGLTALGLIAAAAAAIATAGAPAAASAAEPPPPPHYRPYAKPATAPTAQANLAPVRQNAVSTAVGIGGDALATASNQSLALQNSGGSGNGRGGLPTPLQINRSSSVQTAVSAAVSVGGNSAALASNNADRPQANAGQGPAPGPGLPFSPPQLGRAPSTSTAVSTA